MAILGALQGLRPLVRTEAIGHDGLTSRPHPAARHHGSRAACTRTQAGRIDPT
jgi:hypothetical protein